MLHATAPRNDIPAVYWRNDDVQNGEGGHAGDVTAPNTDLDLSSDLPCVFTHQRHLEPIIGSTTVTQAWRMKERVCFLMRFTPYTTSKN